MRPHTSLMRNGILAACLLLALFPAQLLSAGEEVGLRLSVSVWKRSVLVMEPVLVKLEIRNNSSAPVLVVPPYVDCYLRTDWPLTLGVVGEGGNPVPNQWRYAETGTEPVAFGLPWWARTGKPAAPTFWPPRHPWRAAPRLQAFMWIDLVRFYPLDHAGRYRVVLRYRPEAGMVGPEEAMANARPPLLTPDADIDLGWIEIREPTGRDAEASAWLLERRGSGARTVLSSDEAPILGLTDAFLDRYDGTTYAVYARFYQLLRRLAAAGWPTAEHAAHLQQAEAFTAEHPDFPLNYKLRLAPAFGTAHDAWGRLADRLHLRQAGISRDSADARTEERKAEFDRAVSVLQAELAKTSDQEFRQWAEARLWQWEQTERLLREGPVHE